MNYLIPESLNSLHSDLKNHQMYGNLRNSQDLKIMMETHVFAVWDFMSLLKRLQREITCVEIPWKPSPYPKKLVRLINEIVLGEESDLDDFGNPIDHFSLYLKAMKEVGASTEKIEYFITHMDYSILSPTEKEFVTFNLNLANQAKIHEVAAAFFYGREKLIPDMFGAILNDLELNLHDNSNFKYGNLKFYLERHIALDGGEHSHLAEDCLKILCGDDEVKWNQAINTGIQSLKLRSKLWDEVEVKIKAQH